MAVEWKKALLLGDAAALSDATPVAITEGASASAGTGDNASRDDHEHASPATWAPAPHSPVHEDEGADEILLSSLGEPTSPVPFDGQEAQDLVTHVVADNAAMLALTPVVGKRVFRQDDGHEYICISAS